MRSSPCAAGAFCAGVIGATAVVPPPPEQPASPPARITLAENNAEYTRFREIMYNTHSTFLEREPGRLTHGRRALRVIAVRQKSTC